LSASEAQNRQMSVAEQVFFDADMKEANRLSALIAPLENRPGSLLGLVRTHGTEILFGGGVPNTNGPLARAEASTSISAETMKPEYMAALHAFLTTGGKAHGGELSSGADGTGGYHVPGSERYTQQRMPNGSLRTNAAMYEGTGGGSTSAGGYAVNIPTVQQIIPLGLPDLGVFDASNGCSDGYRCQNPPADKPWYVCHQG